MSFYHSNSLVKTGERFIMSFDVDFTQTNDTVVGFGCDESPNVDDHFKVKKILFVDNCFSLMNKSNEYILDGDYIYRKDGVNDNFFGYYIYEENGVIYEEVKSSLGIDDESKEGLKIRNDKVVREVEGKYIIDNGILKLRKDYTKITGIYVFEDGELKHERYIFGGEIADFKGKLRYIINGDSSVINVSKGEKGVYTNVFTPMYKKIEEKSYIYLYYEGITPKNFLINYKEAEL